MFRIRNENEEKVSKWEKNQNNVENFRNFSYFSEHYGNPVFDTMRVNCARIVRLRFENKNAYISTSIRWISILFSNAA
jgi:hypothetical protein